jgi:hypothetical protein
MRDCTGRRLTVTVTVRINANGTIQAVNVAPAKQTECVLPKLENLKFPPAKQGGEFKYTYTFNK